MSKVATKKKTSKRASGVSKAQPATKARVARSELETWLRGRDETLTSKEDVDESSLPNPEAIFESVRRLARPSGHLELAELAKLHPFLADVHPKDREDAMAVLADVVGILRLSASSASRGLRWAPSRLTDLAAAARRTARLVPNANDPTARISEIAKGMIETRDLAVGASPAWREMKYANAHAALSKVIPDFRILSTEEVQEVVESAPASDRHLSLVLLLFKKIDHRDQHGQRFNKDSLRKQIKRARETADARAKRRKNAVR